jgi:eukaryotic-like serine/threonine-protein kinase
MNISVHILQPLASGGNGDLYIGRRLDDGQLVVVKYLREYQNINARKAFLREIRVLARKLPGLIQLLAANVNAEVPYYVMPYLTGGSLEPYAGQLTEDQLIAVASQVGSTLSSLHAGAVFHGDVKPANVLVSHDGRLQVADPLGNGGGCTMLFSHHRGGTPGYWAPEVSAGGEISCAGDVYSFGAMLYELLTGQKPRDGQDLASLVEGNLSKIAEIITACCQFAADARPTMQEVLRLLSGERWGDISEARRWSRTFWTTAACLVGAVLVGAAMTSED